MEEEVALAPSSAAAWETGWWALCEEADALEKECWEEISQPRSLPSSQLAELLAEREEAQRSAAAWQSAVWSGLGRLRKRSAAVAQNLRQGSCPEQLQAVTLSIEREIDGFRCRQREEFEGLAAEEPGTEEALRALGERFEGWVAEPSALARPLQRRGRASAGAPGPGGAQRSASADVACQPSAGSRSSRGPPASEDAELTEIRESLKELEAEVEQAGGATGGWSEFRHSVFQRLFTMFKLQASETFYVRLAERLPDLPREELVAHVWWWQESEERQATKRQLLARWRARRAELDREAAEAEEGRRAQSLAQQRQAEERNRGLRAEQKRQVAEWRRQRAEEGEMELAANRSALQERERQEREHLKARHQHQKEAIEVHRTQMEYKAAVRERSMDRSGDASRRVLSQEDRQRIAQRNMELLKKRLQAPQPPLPPSGWLPPPPAKSREWAEVESRLHCSTQSSMMKATSKSNSVSDLSPSVAGREIPPRW